MKAVNQSIGRSIRHARDYATIVLVDQRYSRASMRDKLPEWIASQLQICQGFGQAFAAVRKVYYSNLFVHACQYILTSICFTVFSMSHAGFKTRGNGIYVIIDGYIKIY